VAEEVPAVEQCEIVEMKSVLLRKQTEVGEAVNSMTTAKKVAKLNSTAKAYFFNV
jgi:hypothetical protein